MGAKICLKVDLWLIYIGEICMRKCPRYCITISPSFLALAIRIISISVMPPKVAKVSTMVRLGQVSGVTVIGIIAGVIALNFANVNTAFFGILSLEVHSGQNVGGRQNIFSSFLCNDQVIKYFKISFLSAFKIF